MNLDEFLRCRDIKRKDFAERIGTTGATITRIATGQVVPRKDLMRRIYAETCGLVTPNDLIAFKGVRPDTANDNSDKKIE